MSCLLPNNAVIQVELNGSNLPAGFRWRGRAYRVKNIRECWRFTGAWWNEDGEKTFFRVQVDNLGIYELCFDHNCSSWSVTRIED